jgi:hypothetical protein
MIICAFFLGMIGATLVNYVLHEPNSRYDEDELYRNSGHHGPRN